MIEQVLVILKQTADSQTRQWKLTLKLFERIVMTAELTQAKTTGLLANLWKLAEKAGASTTQKAAVITQLNAMADALPPVPGVRELLAKLD